ncbi:MAG: hypothetical protein ACXWP6_08465 [Ktedonobacterales bacterium]
MTLPYFQGVSHVGLGKEYPVDGSKGIPFADVQKHAYRHYTRYTFHHR